LSKKHGLTSRSLFYFWLSNKLLFNRKSLYSGSGPLAFLGLVLGVATLVVSQAVMRGFESTLKNAVIEMNGDLQISRKGKLIESWKDFEYELKSADPQIIQLARFAYTEAVVAKNGKISGVVIQGVQIEETKQVLKFDQRIVDGSMPAQKNEIVVGIGLAKKFNLKVDDQLYIAVPLSTPFDQSAFKRSAQEFTVSGFLDMGKNEWNERMVLLNLNAFQELTQIGHRFNGAFVKITDSNQAVQLTEKLNSVFDSRYSVNNWYNLNRNIVEAAQLEKVVIFFVVFLIVLIAAFNISSTLYVIVRSRYKDIAIFKTLGFNQKAMKNIFLMQGFLIGTMGTMAGFILGFALSYGFMYLQTQFGILPGAIYKIDKIDVQFSSLDFLIIYLSTLLTCVAASYYPAIQASRLGIVEGMKKD
jgi:lipoprotein-releasing system permease protein